MIVRRVANRRALAALLVAAIAAGALPAAAGPPVAGETVPDFALTELPPQDGLKGTEHRLAERLAIGPVVLVFFRGVW